MDEGQHHNDIVNKALSRAMIEVGDEFGTRELYMPDMLLSARAMQTAMSVLKPLLKGDEALVEKGATMDLKVVKEKYKGVLCPIGNINNKKVLVSGTAEDVREEALRCLREGAEDGGYVISSDHSLDDDMPVENVTTYIDTVKKYGKYTNGKLDLNSFYLD